MSLVAEFPDCSVEEGELFKLNAIMTSIVAYESEILTNGMSKAIGFGLESADPGILGNININMLTELGSNTKLGVGLEAIEWRKIGLAVTGISVILGMLIKVYQWIKDRWQGNGSSSTIAAKQKQVADLKKDMAEVKKELEARLKKHAETPISEQAFMNIFPDEETPFNLPFKLNLVEHIRNKKITTKQALIAMSRIQTIAKSYNLYDPAQIGSLILYQATKDVGKTVDMSWVVFCDELRFNPTAFGRKHYKPVEKIPTVFNDITVHYVQGMMSVMRSISSELKWFVDINNRRMNSSEPIEDEERQDLFRQTTAMLDRFHALIRDAGFLTDNKVVIINDTEGFVIEEALRMTKHRYHGPTAGPSFYMEYFPAIIKELSEGLCVLNPRVENHANEEEWIASLFVRMVPLQHVLSRFDLDDVITNHKAVFSSATDKMVKNDADEILSTCKDLKREIDQLLAAIKAGKDILFTNAIKHPTYLSPGAPKGTTPANIDYVLLISSWMHFVQTVTSTLQLYYSTGTRGELGLFRLHELMKKHK